MTQPRRSLTVKLGGALLSAALLLGLTACGDDDEGGSSATTETTGSSSTSTATGPANLDAVAIELTEIASVSQPTAMANRIDDTALYVTEQTGKVRKLTPQAGSGGEAPAFRLESTPVIDISGDVKAGGEQGLLGITFSKDGRRLYLAYTGSDEKQRVDEWQMSGDQVDVDSRRSIFVVDDFANNHNGGSIAIGPDGFLYYGMGDGGGGGDPQATGQNPSDLLGALLRVDPAGGDPYGVPADNPFAGGGGAPEVWSYGLRNPWRFSFDQSTGDLWIADVGQGDWEEINFQPADEEGGKGANFGWNLMEGTHPYGDGQEPLAHVPPLFEYDHSGQRCSVTGGYVYRGQRIPDLAGAYLFADYCQGEIQALVEADNAVVAQKALDAKTTNVSSFGQDNEGEVYVLSLDGKVYRIDPVGA